MSRRKPPLITTPCRCEAPLCDRATQGSKPFCTDHVLSNEYALSVAELNDSVRMDAVEAPSKVPHELDTGGVLAREIVRTIYEDGPKTIERVARDVNYLTSDGARQYAKALSGAGILRLGRTARGVMTLHPVYPRVRA